MLTVNGSRLTPIPVGTGHSLCEHGNEDFTISFSGDAPDAVGFDAYTNGLGPLTVTVFGIDGSQLGAFAINGNGFFGVNSEIPIGTIHWLAVRGEDVDTAIDNVRIGNSPKIEVSQAALKFGNVAKKKYNVENDTYNLPHQLPIIISNTGASASKLAVKLETKAPFSIASSDGEFSLNGGESFRLVVTFNPDNKKSYKRELTIQSNDKAKPKITIPLSGRLFYTKISPRNGSFGQFYYRDRPRVDDIQIDPDWRQANIVLYTLPVLNRAVEVHRLAAPSFVAAFSLIEGQGLSELVQSYDGLFVPRYQRNLAHNPKNLSNHSWGTAIDINDQHPRGHNRTGQPISEDNKTLWKRAFEPVGGFR